MQQGGLIAECHPRWGNYRPSSLANCKKISLLHIRCCDPAFRQVASFDLQRDAPPVYLSKQHDAASLSGLHQTIKHDEQLSGLDQHFRIDRSLIYALRGQSVFNLSIRDWIGPPLLRIEPRLVSRRLSEWVRDTREIKALQHGVNGGERLHRTS